MGYLAIIWHSRTGAARALAEALEQGAREAETEGNATRESRGKRDAAVRRMRAEDVTPQDLLGAAAYVFVCPENLASMTGAMKEMFDVCYYPLLGQVEGRGYATVIAAGADGMGAQTQIERIVTGWRLRRIAEPVIVKLGAQTPEEIGAPKKVASARLAQCRELGKALASGLAMGVF